MITQMLFRALDRKAVWIIVALCVIAVAIPAGNLLIGLVPQGGVTAGERRAALDP